MPGTCTSMEYRALPFTLNGTSTRPMSLRPISLKSLRFLRSPSAIFGSSAGTLANFATSPYEMLRFDFLWMTLLLSVVSSATGTFHSAATASSSTLRACAPACRSGTK